MLDQGPIAEELPAEPEQGPNLYVLACSGDHDAQLQMAHLALAEGVAGVIPMRDAILEAKNWANMATTSGRARHMLAFAGMLLTQASFAVSNGVPEDDCGELMAGALAIVDKAADAGHSGAEMVSFALASRLKVKTIERAQAMQANIIIAPLTAEEKRDDQAGLDWLTSALTADALGSC